MNFIIVHTGLAKEAYWRDAFSEYQKRCRKSLVDLALKPQKLPDDPNPNQISQALDKEDAAIEEALKARNLTGPDTVRYCLCIEGKALSTEALAQHLQNHKNQGCSNAVFLIGSSYGLSERIKKTGFALSFSPMTFPHQMAKVMLAEQLYRVTTIWQQKKYHK